MSDSTKTGLAIAFVVASWLSLAFGGEITSGTAMGGLMTDGVGTVGIGWMFRPTLFLGSLAVAVVVVASILKRK